MLATGDPAKMNLVTSDNVYIDPYHLVLKTKAQTDAARKIESLFQGNTNNRDTKKVKTKGSVNADHAKKEEQVKNNSKRINRLRLERKLQQITESFVTRNVNDKIFQIPEFVDEDPKWSVPIKWTPKDPRSALPENADGEFDPDLLLRYALEMIELPSGRKLFAWLIKQVVIQSYFVLLFWMIKVKFFETDFVDEKEVYLLHKLSREYRKLVEMLAQRSHAEHEKDFVFKYLPFILSNGVFYAFFYLFPGSRHSTNTKAFKKTVYMQVVQIMHGFQVCPISVKVSWAKLFPEDAHDGENLEDGEEGKEIFPVPFAVKATTQDLSGTGKRSTGSPTLRRNRSQLPTMSRPTTAGSPSGRETAGSWDDGRSEASSPSTLMRRSRTALLASRSKSGMLALDSTSLDDSTSAPSVVKRFATTPTGGKGSPLRFGSKRAHSTVTSTSAAAPKLARGMSRKSSMGDLSRSAMSMSGSMASSGGGGGGLHRGSRSLSFDDDDEDEDDYEEVNPFSEENITHTLAAMKSKPQLQRKPSVAKLAMQRTVSIAKLQPPPNGNSSSSSAINLLAANTAANASSLNMLPTTTTTTATAATATVSAASGTGSGSGSGSDGGDNAINSRPNTASTAASIGIADGGGGGGMGGHHTYRRTTDDESSHLFTTKNLGENPRYLRPLSKTNLKPPPVKPPNVASVKRQGVVDRISAQQVSPQMALLLSELKDTGTVDSNSTFSQTVRRTIPVNWCPAGGTDTHHRTVISTELHHEISDKLTKSKDEFKHISSLAHHRKIKIAETLNKELDKVRFSVSVVSLLSFCCSRVGCTVLGSPLSCVACFVVVYGRFYAVAKR